MKKHKRDLHELTATAALALFRAGELDPLYYARSLVDRARAIEPRLKAFAHFDPEAFLAAAEKASFAVKSARSSGDRLSALVGVPVGVKDNIDTKGIPTAAGSPLYKNRVPLKDAACLEPLWHDGAILHSKTVTTELAYFDPGPTRNPWNTQHTPGGSSSGSAAGVAAGLFPVALGTQTGGSVIRPASYCGIVGFVPTHGILPMEGILPFARTVDGLGIFARRVEDAALVFESLSVSRVGESLGRKPEIGPLPPLERAPYLGLAREYFVEEADDEMGRMVIHAARHLVARGAVVHVAHLPESFSQVHAYHRRLMEMELAREQCENFQASRASFGRKVAELIESGLEMNELDYRRALTHRERFRSDAAKLVRELDAILLPAAPSAAPFGLESTGDPRFSIPWTNAGFPVVTLPAGLSSTGLPLGVQLVGAPGTDLHLLRVARAVEDLLEWGRGVVTPEHEIASAAGALN